MKLSNRISESKGVSETSIFNNIGPVPILKNSSEDTASCRAGLGKSTENIPSKKRGPAMRTSLYLKIMTLTICAVLALFACGLHGMAETQESYTTDDAARPVLQVVSDADDPLSGTWVLNLSKSKFPQDFPFPKSQITRAVVDASDIEITQETASQSDELLNLHVKARFDGKDYPITGAPGSFSVAYQRVDKNTIKAVLKSEGKAVVQETGVISADGRSFTVTYDITDATGKQITGTAVFEKK